MKIGIADTTFARVDMAAEAIDALRSATVELSRYTVPGMKDLPAASVRLLREQGCDLVIALGWVGGKDIDERCAHEANIGLIMAEVQEGKHILKVFFHESEAPGDERRQTEIALDRARKHALNALLLRDGTGLTPFAGQGRRQGYADAGAIEVRP